MPQNSLLNWRARILALEHRASSTTQYVSQEAHQNGASKPPVAPLQTNADKETPHKITSVFRAHWKNCVARDPRRQRRSHIRTATCKDSCVLLGGAQCPLGNDGERRSMLCRPLPTQHTATLMDLLFWRAMALFGWCQGNPKLREATILQGLLFYHIPIYLF